MSLTSALNNAASGLAANARMAETISTNTANALTEGYARREVSLSSAQTGGVRIDSVTRVVSEALLKEKRLADAAVGNATTRADFHAQIEDAIGDSETDGSLSSLLSDFDTALVDAAAQPESTSQLTAVATAAKAVADKLNTVSQDIQDARLDADRSIASQVDTLNSSLQQIAALNTSITRMTAQGADASSLMDQRQSLVDTIAAIVPVNTVSRSGNQIALVTTGGQTLLDGTAATVGFTGATVMSAGMTLADGDLSGLTINGRAVNTSDSGGMGGGTLGASFAVRDELAPAAQKNLDAVARDLVERFSDSAVDSTLTSDSPGLFTDMGSSFDSSNEAGLAGRIQINSAVDPDSSAEVWRLRDGLGATSQGNTGSSSLLTAMESALTASRTTASGSFAGASHSASSLAADMLSLVSTNRIGAEATESYASARQEAAADEVTAQGVDSDYEIQSLLVVQQAYAANAKVLSALDDMMQSILEL